MVYFLEHIAKHLYSEYGNRLNKHCLIFPNRRAGLFFLKYLAKEISKPAWTPAIMTINDLFRSLSELQLAENEILLFELYKVYRTARKSNESFDDFYFWGDMLLNDFDDVDKNLGDASKIFHNIQDIKEIEREFGGLTDEQADVVKRFWTNFDPERMSDQKKEFSSVWSILNAIYEGFRRSLKEKNLAYEGMIFRDVIEGPGMEKLTAIKWESVHFAGFNALNKCEKLLMSKLKDENRAKFYWDYDNSYIREGRLNSAGFFLKDNLKYFGNDMPGEWSYETMLSKPAASIKRRVIDTSSDVAQVKLIPEMISEIPGLTPENAHETAVILADENLIMPVLTSLPENIPDINITMGYPLRQTLIYSLVKHLLDLQRNARVQDGTVLFNHRDVLSLLKNGLLAELISESDREIIKEITEQNLIMVPSDRFSHCQGLANIFIKADSPASFPEYLKSVLSLVVSADSGNGEESGNDSTGISIRNEFIYRVMLSINRLDAVTGLPELTLTLNTWISLFERLLRNQSVPFSGEPLSGIQVMGILETRTLDFRNLVILSVNEGILPALTSASSFIPFSLREAFGLPSINHRESVYAYHFYRLLQRAENVTFIYNSDPEGLRSGEMSRFLQQMKYEPLLKPEMLNLSFEIRTRGNISEMIDRTEEQQNQLMERFSPEKRGRILSPSAVNTWLNCRMKFYYRYVCGLKEPDEITGDIDPAILGTILHEAMRSLYEDFTGKRVDAESVMSLISDPTVVSGLIKRTIRKFFGRGNYNVATGNELIAREVLVEYIMRILKTDKAMAPFSIIDLEKQVTFPVNIENGNTMINIAAGGVIDRVDLKDGTTRILDYKTGTIADSISSIEDLFADDRKKDYDGWLQTLLYCEGYLNEKQDVKVRPSIYQIKKSHGEDLLKIKPGRNNEIPVDDYTSVRHEYMSCLNATVKAIFSIDEPFFMTSDDWNKCSYCPYRALCMR
jgi:CRISPR/Cas system-associated exonuclease Cas4 (RecB family)